MGPFSFIGDAGKKLLGRDKDPAPQTPEEVADFAIKLKEEVLALGLPVDHLGIRYQGGTVTVRGEAADQATIEKIILVVGNTAGVTEVDDLLTLEVDTAAETIVADEFVGPEPESAFHTVTSGETLGAIAAAHYGVASLYTLIFEANTPMLEHPDAIYPGQVLRIPPVTGLTHTVASGDTLGKIAKLYLGDASRYAEIFEANRDQLSNPDAIAVGQRLVIPVRQPGDA